MAKTHNCNPSGSAQNITTLIHTQTVAHTHRHTHTMFVLQWKIFTTTAASCLATLWRQTEFPSHSCMCVCDRKSLSLWVCVWTLVCACLCVCVTECLLGIPWEGKHRSILYLAFCARGCWWESVRVCVRVAPAPRRSEGGLTLLKLTFWLKEYR